MTVDGAPSGDRVPCGRDGGANRGIALVFLPLLLSLAAAACERSDRHGALPSARIPTRPWLVIAIDGADWDVLHRLWHEDRAPALRQLTERGSSAVLRTAYVASPVIWTTIATGLKPGRHGIEDFVVPTRSGDRPVSSDSRRVPALWNMLTDSQVPSAWLGWWATWPAESIAGIIVSDRALETADRALSPPGFEPTFRALAREALSPATPLALPDDGVGARDRTMAWIGRHLLLSDELPLVVVYFRSLDIESHFYWKYHEPERFAVPAQERARVGDPVTRVYQQVDQAVASLLEAAGDDVNVLVISDHGFRPLARERIVVQLDFDRLLASLGFLEPGPGGVDLEASRLYTWASRPTAPERQLRFGGAAPEGAAGREALAAELESALARVTWPSGEPAFELRRPTRRAAREGVDLVVRVRRAWADEADEALVWRGQELDVDLQVTRISGTHSSSTHGILIAAGPDVAAGASLEGISIHDLAPTLCYALGLPVAEDMAGRAWPELLAPASRPALETIPTWGERERSLEQDEHMTDAQQLRELRALGYIE